MRSLILKVGINAVAIWIATMVVDPLRVSRGDGSTIGVIAVFLLLGLIFGVVNTIVKPVVKFFTLPFYFLSLGLVAFVVNALMLSITAGLAGSYFDIGSFWSGALPAAVIVTFVSLILHIVLPDPKDHDRKRDTNRDR
ncbi:MAG: phage holin family protein [Actinomycetota bacterium]